MKICAVTTTYYPSEELILNNFNLIKDKIQKYIRGDNSCNFQFNILNKVENIIIIKNSFNCGVSKGINIGIEKASEFTPEYLIFFDQDSLVGKNMISDLINYILNDSAIKIIVPNVFDINTNKELHKKYFNVKEYDKIKEIESTQLAGMFVEYNILKINKFNENYFLDYVDSEWCWRIKQQGYKIFLLPYARLYHSFGEGEKNILGYRFYYGKPFRMYYTSRDILYSIKYSQSSQKRKIKLVLKFFMSWFEVLLLDSKIARWKYLLKGTIHYFKGIRGKGIEI